jgi:UDP-glucose 4-epimerase
MNILITGVAGFIGSSIAKELVKDTNLTIIGIDNMYSGTKENLSTLSSFKNFKFYHADIRDYESLNNIFQTNNIQYVYHLAAIVSVQESIKNPLFTSSVNVQGTLNILELARKSYVKKIVFSSSAAVYGDEPTLPKNESSLTKPISPYGYEKLISEYYMKLYNDLYGIETIILRYFNVYGKGQVSTNDYSGVISKFSNNFERNIPSSIYGDGDQYRDFIHVNDVVKANISAMNTSGIGGEIFCVGTSHPVTINTVFALLNKKYHRILSPVYLQERHGDIIESVSDNTKIKHLLGINNFIGFEEGIEKL